MIGIYKITSPTGKVYVGQSVNIEKRFKEYFKLRNCKGQVKLYNSFIKYNVKKHSFEVIEECNIELLNDRERYYQDLYSVLTKGLNCILTKSTDRIMKCSDETKLKMKNSSLGFKHTEESKIKMSESQKRQSKETRLRKSIAATGRKLSEDHKLKVSIARKKIILNIETGIFYDGRNEAAIAHGINVKTFYNKMSGNRKNNTNLIYV